MLQVLTDLNARPPTIVNRGHGRVDGATASIREPMRYLQVLDQYLRDAPMYAMELLFIRRPFENGVISVLLVWALGATESGCIQDMRQNTRGKFPARFSDLCLIRPVSYLLRLQD